MKIFILSYIWENIFINNLDIENFLSGFSLALKKVKIWCISGYFWDISDSEFVEVLPILNWLTWKYFFYNSLNTSVSQNYIFWKNILDFEYDDKEILNNSKQIENIKLELNSTKLITNSKKDEFSQIILTAIYNIWWFLIKTFFLMEEMILNKNDLQKIISDPNWLIEYKAQANLLDKITFDKLDLIKVRFDTLNLELNSFAEILYKYFKNYIK